MPRCKGGTEIVPTCHSCEDFIHKTWSHNELRDTFNSVESILADARFLRVEAPTDPFWNANRTSVPGLGANECVPD